MIYHLIEKEQWELCCKNSSYKPNSVDREGYIHCSFEEQIMKVANTFYKNQKNLLILCINEKKLTSSLKVEDLFNLNEAYPHIYGELPIKSIVKVISIEVDSNGEFIKPNLEILSSLVVKQKEWT